MDVLLIKLIELDHIFYFKYKIINDHSKIPGMKIEPSL